MIRLNLLPPNMKENIEYGKKNAAIFQLLIKLIAGFVVMVAVVGLVGYVVYMNQKVATEEKETAEAQLASWKTTERDAKDFANRLNLVDKIRGEKIDWPLVFSELAKSVPANVKLTSYDFTNNKVERVDLSGFAISNTDIGTFREILSKSNLFQYVDIESVAQATDPDNSARKGLTFRITMTLNQTEAKK
jgi:Tfp pilus assembly protein PilN